MTRVEQRALRGEETFTHSHDIGNIVLDRITTEGRAYVEYKLKHMEGEKAKLIDYRMKRST